MKLLILGGGISALAAAWRLSKLCPQAEVTLLEKSDRLGGWIRTKEAGGMLFEEGPRTFSAARSPSLLNLISEVGLDDELLFSKQSATKRYLWHRGSLRSLGSHLLPHAWRLFYEPFIPRGKEEETIHAFACRRFGKKLAELLFDPLTLGVYAGDSRTLSMQACFPRLVQMEQQHGSLVLAMLRRKRGKRFPGTLFTLQRGMQSLIDALSSQLRAKILLQTEVTRLIQEPKGWRVETNRGTFAADALLSALPAHTLRSLLPTMPHIASASVTVANIGFSELAMPKSGYGYLVPSSEREELLGMIWDSEVFGGSGCKMTAMIRSSASSPQAVVLDALSRHLQIRRKPDFLEIERAEQAIPQLAPNELQALHNWETSLRDLYLLGNYLEGPAVESCIARSGRIAQRF